MTAEEKKPKYEPIGADSLTTNTTVPFDLYLYLEGTKEFALFRSFNLPFKEEHRRRLAENRVDRLYIDASDRKKYISYVESNLHRIAADEAMDPSRKAAIIYSAASSVLQDTLASPESAGNIQRCNALANNIVPFVLQGEQALKELPLIAVRDYYIHTHSVNVCFTGTMLAARLGYTDADDLRNFACGALLHDIGKSRISKRVLSRKGPLSKDEWKLIKRHPEFAVELLKETEGVSDASKVICLQHHEKIDGSGYPYGLPDDQIHPFAKICCVVDMFDALTARRPYADAFAFPSALKTMKKENSRQIDRKVFKTLASLLREHFERE